MLVTNFNIPRLNFKLFTNYVYSGVFRSVSVANTLTTHALLSYKGSTNKKRRNKNG